jgi:hypothetical protein
MFDRFAIAEGYYLFYAHWHMGGLTERCHRQGRGIAEQLHRMRFRPSPLLTLDTADESTRDVYDALVDRYHGGS